MNRRKLGAAAFASGLLLRTPSKAVADEATEAANIALVRRLFSDVLTPGDPDAIPTVLAPDYAPPEAYGREPGIEGYLDRFTRYQEQQAQYFDAYEYIELDIIARDDVVAYYGLEIGNTKDGRKTTVVSVVWYYCKDGLIISQAGGPDYAELNRQLFGQAFDEMADGREIHWYA